MRGEMKQKCNSPPPLNLDPSANNIDFTNITHSSDHKSETTNQYNNIIILCPYMGIAGFIYYCGDIYPNMQPIGRSIKIVTPR